MAWPVRLVVCALAVLAYRMSSVGASSASNNWAVLVCTSRFWFNYRHMANTLAMYRTVKRLGIPDSHIVLMLADDAACNPRNPFAATVYSNADRRTDLYGDRIEVDYKGEEVNVETFLRLLSGRLPPSTPASKRLLTDSRSNIFVYMTGHGGDEFLKFQDNEEISAFDLADAFGGMWSKGRYNEILFMVDTCQANTLYKHFYSPNILATGSSEKGENSYSHHADNDIGVAVTDRYTHQVLTFLERINQTSTATMQDLFSTFDFSTIHSTAGVRTDLFPRRPDETLLTDFFGGVSRVEFGHQHGRERQAGQGRLGDDDDDDDEVDQGRAQGQGQGQVVQESGKADPEARDRGRSGTTEGRGNELDEFESEAVELRGANRSGRRISSQKRLPTRAARSRTHGTDERLRRGARGGGGWGVWGVGAGLVCGQAALVWTSRRYRSRSKSTS
ncbi:hypothetical protein JCM10212_002356 [Sporobolomyces blumeae]